MHRGKKQINFFHFITVSRQWDPAADLAADPAAPVELAVVDAPVDAAPADTAFEDVPLLDVVVDNVAPAALEVVVDVTDPAAADAAVDAGAADAGAA